MVLVTIPSPSSSSSDLIHASPPSPPSSSSHPIPIRLITHNIRFAIAEPVQGEEPWSVRCPKVCAQLRFLAQNPGNSVFICLQEALHSQLQDILTHLNGDASGAKKEAPEWDYIGVGRDDGQTAGEFSPVLFRKRVWDCEESRTYWLSETPDVPGSKGWDANNVRVATIGRFRRLVGDASTAGPPDRVLVMSTHLDHIGEVSRRESAKLLLRIADEWTESGLIYGGDGGSGADTFALPLFLGGDFNSTPEDDAYKIIVRGICDDHDDNGNNDGGGGGKQNKRTRGMADVSQVVPVGLHYGNHDITYTAFGKEDVPKRIDFLFTQVPPRARSLSFAILPNSFDDGVLLSDHRAVVADFEIPARAG